MGNTTLRAIDFGNAGDFGQTALHRDGRKDLAGSGLLNGNFNGVIFQIDAGVKERGNEVNRLGLGNFDFHGDKLADCFGK